MSGGGFTYCRILQVLCRDTIGTVQYSLLRITFLLQWTLLVCTLSRSDLILFFCHLNFSWEDSETVIAILSVCFLRPCHITSGFPSHCFPSFQNFRQCIVIDRAGVACGGLSWSFARSVDKILITVKPARSFTVVSWDFTLFLNGAEEKDKWVEYSEKNLFAWWRRKKNSFLQFLPK